MMETLSSEFSNMSPVSMGVLFLRIFGALILCGIIGLEREIRKNTAGIRTNMLIGLAASVFALVTLQMLKTFGDADTTRMDPVRLVEAVTSGVAFLAAGVIVYARGDVRGLTTGASMWVSAAIGLTVGIGMWSVAIIATVTGILVLWLLRKAEHAAGIKGDGDP
ncbi:putative Mg2+ transporter-C (MgtC) family protein [Pseudorhizobium tarimense]|uniref:Protein MgtC n=1 Tax=Pseudorhizobium tarimense TaxID=1079109 RepID=A0ABV2H3N7_9HYPH|nr:MgtC/SapB family protein [Pseudorhizobium tarimense]MCJ8518467.1 MgtC/SapB family protein [Pseudorhizobium tarimense]